MYTMEDPTSDTLIRTLTTNEEALVEAVEECIRIAGLEYRPNIQKFFMSAASYGKVRIIFIY